MVFSFINAYCQNVGIGTNTPKAALDVTSSSNGFLPPRMTYAQRSNISNPSAGLMVWCSDCGAGGAGDLSIYNGTEWRSANISTISTVVPTPPANLTVTASNPLVYATLNWTDASNNETGFRIERKIGTGTFTTIGQVGSNITTYRDSSITQSTTYVYRVFSINSAGSSVQSSNEYTLITNTSGLPVLSTTSITSITSNSAVSGGNITANGGSAVTSRGVCWSTSPNPTIALSTKTINGSGNGNFTSNITSLSAGNTYYVRAYAINNNGVSYGDQLIFNTLNSVVNLSSVTIGTQIWSSKNLDISKYRNGDPIPQITDPIAWQNDTLGAWCWYNNDSTTYGATYGKLYNWYAIKNTKGFAPQGWHVPTTREWNKLLKYLDPNADTTCTFCIQSLVAGSMLKETGTAHWESPNNDATNSTGFTALPGGFRNMFGDYVSLNSEAYWYTADSFNNLAGWDINISSTSSDVENEYSNLNTGFSVRVVKD